MAIQQFDQDILPHLGPDTLESQAIISQACLTVFNKFGVKLVLCYEINGPEICVNAKLEALGQSVDLGKACIRAGQSTTLSGKIDDLAKAEITISVSMNPLQLCFDAKACIHVPFSGWKCATTGKHCIGI